MTPKHSWLALVVLLVLCFAVAAPAPVIAADGAKAENGKSSEFLIPCQ